MLLVTRHEGQEGGQVGELESQERVLDESVEAAITVATESWRSYQQNRIFRWLVGFGFGDISLTSYKLIFNDSL